MNKQIICIILVLIMVLSAFAGCSQKGEEKTDTSDTSVQTESGTESESEKPELMVKKFGTEGNPREFTMAVRASRYDYLWAKDEVTSDKVKASVVERNKMVEENFNVKIGITELKDDKSGAEWFTKLTNAGDDSIDLAVPDYWWGVDRKGLMMDIGRYDDGVINLSDRWWYQGWLDSNNINGHCYLLAGDATLEALENLEVVFYNSEMASNKQLDLFKIVKDGDWTLEKMKEICIMVSENLDDDDKSNDIYGAIYDIHSIRSGLFSLGMKVVTVSKETGALVLTAGTDKNTNICDQFSDFLQIPSVDVSTATARARDISLFKSSKALFYAGYALKGRELLQIEGFDYNVIPCPKMDKSDDYVSTTYGLSPFGVPVCAEDYEMSSYILNAINYYSADTVVTTFYDTVLKYRQAVEESANMLDLIREKLYVDFAFVNENDDLNVMTTIQVAVVNGNSTAVAIEGVKEKTKAQLEELTKFYQ